MGRFFSIGRRYFNCRQGRGCKCLQPVRNPFRRGGFALKGGRGRRKFGRLVWRNRLRLFGKRKRIQPVWDVRRGGFTLRGRRGGRLGRRSQLGLFDRKRFQPVGNVRRGGFTLRGSRGRRASLSASIGGRK